MKVMKHKFNRILDVANRNKDSESMVLLDSPIKDCFYFIYIVRICKIETKYQFFYKNEDNIKKSNDETGITQQKKTFLIVLNII